MSVRSVATKDLLATRRSRALWTMATLIALLFAAIAYGFESYDSTTVETVQELYAVVGLVLAFLLPIVALVASYMSIAGERESGGVKFLLGFPNTRSDVFLGKLASRLLTVSTGIAFLFLAVTCVAAAKHGVVLPALTVGLFALTVVYGAAFVSLAVSLSAMCAARSRAIAAAMGSYLLLVLLYVVPAVRLTSIVRWIHTTILGSDPNVDLYNAITYTSPYVAYRKAINLLLPPERQATVFRRPGDAGDLPVYLTDEVSLVVLAAWIAIPLVVGYRRFDRSDLH